MTAIVSAAFAIVAVWIAAVLIRFAIDSHKRDQMAAKERKPWRG